MRDRLKQLWECNEQWKANLNSRNLVSTKILAEKTNWFFVHAHFLKAVLGFLCRAVTHDQVTTMDWPSHENLRSYAHTLGLSFQVPDVHLIPRVLDWGLLSPTSSPSAREPLPQTGRSGLVTDPLHLSSVLAQVLLGTVPVSTPLAKPSQSLTSPLQAHPLDTFPKPVTSST